MDFIIPAFEMSLFDSSLRDASFDVLEVGLDSLLEDGLLKDLPIVGLLVGISKTAQNIYDRNLLKQTLIFIKEFNAKTIPRDKLESHRNKLLDDPKSAEKELGRVIVLLNANVDVEKSSLMGRFYKAYVLEQITWECFCELSDVVNRMFISDLGLLYRINDGSIKDTMSCAEYRADRLISLGLVRASIGSAVIGLYEESRVKRYLTISELGETFCDLSVVSNKTNALC